ncbi:MAG TPA: TetR/AcrR family transcriptional regulator [Halanaerobiales bacterium]|nr:TetR/AcrR family transcriptional regulator [Halanaerobiales bacterium]
MPTTTFFNLPEEKKKRVINAAVDEFAQNGYTKSSITRMVNKAQIAKGSFYQYFEDKEDLYRHILKKAVEKKFKYVQKELNDYEGDDFFEYWRRLNIAGLKYAEDNIKLAEVASDIVKNKDQKFYRSIIDEYKNLGEGMFERLLKKAVEAGQVRKDINITYTAGLLYRASFFITDYFFEKKDIKQLDEFIPLIDNLIEIIQYGIKKEGG